MKKLVICDDEPERLQEWVTRLTAVEPVRSTFEIQALTDAELLDTVAELEGRRSSARASKPSRGGASLLDSADLLIVDFDLISLDEKSYQTGEGVAYLARCFSRCGYVIELNQFGENSFDLTLRGHPDSFADLNLGSRQIDNHGLWSCQFPAFRPWAWPIVPAAVDAFYRRVASVGTMLDRPIFEALQLGFAERGWPRNLVQFVAGAEKPEDVTFRSFVSRSGQGLRGRDAQDAKLDDESIARIAAARLGRWLERVVLPAQNVLVDAPHVVGRFPSLLAGDPANRGSWNATAASLCGSTGLKSAALTAHAVGAKDWLTRPVWWWQSLANDESIPEVKAPWDVQPEDLVFCEDTSRFVSSSAAEPFVADVSSPFARRFVEGTKNAALKGIDYEPLVAFAS